MIRSVQLLALTILLTACSGGTGPVPPATEPPPPPPAAATDQAVVLTTPTGVLHGTLRLPASAGPHRLVVLHPGSGPTDRHGNSPLGVAAQSQRLLAHELAEREIATLRYDKRGIAASAAAAPSEADLRFDHFVDDLAAWVRQMRADPRFGAIAIAGHSEGALIAKIAAQRERVEGVVSIAGIGRPFAEVLREQLRPQLTPELWAESERILAALERGETTEEVPAALLSLYRPSVQPYLISLLRFHPTTEIARVPGRVQIVQGTTDIQVTVADAHLLAAARPDAELVIVEGMNHVLKLVPADPARQIASYSDPDLPVAPVLVERLAAFVASLTR